jgi:hypothetical protein
MMAVAGKIRCSGQVAVATSRLELWRSASGL